MEQEAMQKTFEEMQSEIGFSVIPCEEQEELHDKSRFERLEMSDDQKRQVSALMQNIPMAVASQTVSNLYMVRFPEGLPHVLTQLRQGGLGSMIQVNGRFAGSASLYNMAPQAAIMGAFTAMSVASGQYFMAQINSELKMINQKMDEILEFLYGDKRAELMSEITFVKYAYCNFSSIMEHDVQCSATIGSFQEAKKVAMKDIEFYLHDLDNTVAKNAKNYSDLKTIQHESMQIKGSLDLSIQLYIMSSLLEMQYSQNTDKGYLDYLESEVTTYVKKCDSRILSAFSSLKSRMENYKAKPIEKVEKGEELKEFSAIIDTFNTGEDSEVQKTVKKVIRAVGSEKQYYVKANGEVYLLKSV